MSAIGPRSPKRTFWAAFAAGGSVPLALFVLFLIVPGIAGASGAIYPGVTLAVGVGSAYLAYVWGGRRALIGFVTGFLGLIAVAILVVFVCALVVLRSLG